ncbi:MAG: RNA polymerase sigma factor, partial [Candidatus Colwellbacteria bacterium]|nr:RNA polymerase sigma factor [Candidatus Colwellbacteria bacterium]
FGQLYDHYMPMIYRFILLKVAQREEAEDLTHQVFLKAWTSIGSKYSEKGLPFSSWLYRIARNVVIDKYRRTKPTVDLDEDLIEITSHLDLEQKIDIKNDVRKIFDAINKLKEIEKDTVIMRFVEDLSIKEVSESLGKSEGAVKLIQHRAIEKIRKIMEDNG